MLLEMTGSPACQGVCKAKKNRTQWSLWLCLLLSGCPVCHTSSKVMQDICCCAHISFLRTLQQCPLLAVNELLLACLSRRKKCQLCASVIPFFNSIHSTAIFRTECNLHR